MTSRRNMISFILLSTVQFYAAPTHAQSAINETQDEVPLSVDFFRELMELPPFNITQPQTVRTLLTDENRESLSSDLYHPVYTLMCSVKVQKNAVDPEVQQREVSSILPQVPIEMHTDTESIDTDLGALLACGDLGPLSLDDINIDPLSSDTEMEILLNDTFPHRNTSMAYAKHQLNTSQLQAYQQLPAASFGSGYRKIRNVDEQRDTNMVCPRSSGLACRQSIESVPISSSQSFVQSDLFKNHFVNQTGQKPFKSGVHKTHFNASSDCQEHRRTHTFKYDVCSKQLNSTNEYQKYRRVYTGEKSFKCEFCRKEINERNNNQANRRIHTGRKPFHCDICPKEFLTSSDFQKHRRIHTGEKPFKCDFCQKGFSDPSSCKKHRRIHTGEKPFKCDFCPKEFSDPSSYQRHRRIHTSEKPFKCDFCQKEFSYRNGYQKHRRIHTGEKQHQCDMCPKQFDKFRDYQRHRRTHTGEKPFNCDFCQKKFSQLCNYQRHRRTHTGEKPFKYDFCQKKFSDPGNYQTHRRIHTGEKPYQCDTCPKLFHTAGGYQRHRQTHSSEKSYICYWCNEDYCSKRNLIEHVSKCSSRNVSYTANPTVSCFIDSGNKTWTYMQ